MPAVVQKVREPHEDWRAVGLTGNEGIRVVSKVRNQFLEVTGRATN